MALGTAAPCRWVSACSFVQALKVFSLAESLGGAWPIDHPTTMTHACIPKDTREARDISDGLTRISVGIEQLDELRDDLLAGLDRTRARQ